MSESRRVRGYFSIGIFHPKHEENVGTLWRTAHILGASYLYTIGRRYKPQSSDTTKAYRSIPCFNFQTLDDFLEHIPRECRVICVENSKNAYPIKNFVHPEQASYLLGAEDHGLPSKVTDKFPSVILPGSMCYNVSVAGSLVMYDRISKGEA